MTHTDNNGDNAEQREKRYYYHSDHLGSAQFVTDWRGKQYEHIEYTPYGELWIEEVAAGLDKLPFRFTGKEMDEETGLYYYGARYLDPKYSRWLSGDPALSDYIPKAPIDDEAKKHNENLPGMGGVYNIVNMHLYHYAGNNPVKYTDPDGRALETPWDIANGVLGSISGYIELSERQYGKAALSFFGAILDFTAACAPCIPGGVSIGIKVFQHGNTAYGAISNIAEGVMEDDKLKIGIGILQMFGMALGEAGSHYFKYAESAFERAKLVPRSMIVGFICSGIRDKHMGIFYKVMSMLGVSADVVKSSYEAYQSWMNNHKKEEIDQ
nr:RHS repeat-associated core domain-containing protein [Treponema vincentii]